MEQCPNDFWHKRKMYNFDPYNGSLAIATNIPQRLNTGFWSRVTFQLEEKKPLASLLRPQEGASSKILLMHGSSKHKN